MTRFGPIILAFVLLVSAVPVQASTVLMGDYLKFKNNEDFRALYLQGFLDGTGFTNAAFANDNRQMAYCEPGDLALSVDNLKDIVDSHYKKNSDQYKANYQKEFKDLKELPFGLVAILALREAFPCKW